MTKKWKRKKRPRPFPGPTRGKYRQMWKVEMREMTGGEEDRDRGSDTPAADFSGHLTDRAA